MTLQEIQTKLGFTKYSTLYIKITEKSLQENRIKLKKDNVDYIYYEAHHILPKSIFKGYAIFKDNPWNKVLLTAREHFICHILLMKHYRKIKKTYEYQKMSKALTSLKMKNTYNSKIYEKLKLNLGHSEETKLKMSNSRKGIIFTDEHKLNLSKANLGKKLSKETRLKMSNSRKNIGLKNCSKLIEIYDNNDILRYSCNGSFEKTCKDFNLPFNALKSSYQNDGTPLYTTTKPNILSRIKNTNNYRLYKGWYALEKIII